MILAIDLDTPKTGERKITTAFIAIKSKIKTKIFENVLFG